jgi:putative lipoprotein
MIRTTSASHRVTAALASAVASFLALIPAASADPAASSSSDEWFGRDKALHFSAAAGLAAGGYAVGTALWSPPRLPAVALGGGLALGLGAAKEGWDALGHGDPSWKDFTWDAIGAVCGLAVAYAVDWAVRGGAPPPVIATSSTRGALLLRF